MRILLDTHVALWAIADSAKIPEQLRPLLESRENIVYYSVVSVWEVALKHAIHPQNLPIPEERFVELCDRVGFARLGVEPEHIYAVKSLARRDGAPEHRDPFDRLLIAQAKSEGLAFATHDRLLQGYDESCMAFF